jgi:hypothetical protein
MRRWYSELMANISPNAGLIAVPAAMRAAKIKLK